MRVRLMSALAPKADIAERDWHDRLCQKADIASIGRVAFVMVVNPAFAAKTVPELIGNAKANPGKINMATVGPGSPVQIDGRCGSSHGELSRYRASVARSHQRPGGSHFHVYIASTIEYIRSGKLRPWR